MSKQATRKQVIEINKQMEQVCKKTSDGYCEYVDGWNDQRVAAAVGCLANSVAAFRKEVVGKLRPAQSDHALRIEEQQKIIADQAKQLEVQNRLLSQHGAGIAALIENHNKLVIAVSIGRLGLDVRNLAVRGY